MHPSNLTPIPVHVDPTDPGVRRGATYLVLLEAALDEFGAADVDGALHVQRVVLEERAAVDDQQRLETQKTPTHDVTQAVRRETLRKTNRPLHSKFAGN